MNQSVRPHALPEQWPDIPRFSPSLSFQEAYDAGIIRGIESPKRRAEEKEAMEMELQGANLDLRTYLHVVNSSRPVSQEFIDTHMEIIEVTNDRGQIYPIEKRTWYYFRKLKKYLEETEGIIIDLDSAYRSLKDQQDIIDMFTEEFGADYAYYYASPPGVSEHHTGLAVDVCLIVNGEVIDENVAMNAETEIFSRIHAVLPDFGFILDFPYESWHFRFVGTSEIAHAYYDSGMSFPAFSDWYIEKSGQ